jgi:hypothetical protein
MSIYNDYFKFITCKLSINPLLEDSKALFTLTLGEEENGHNILINCCPNFNEEEKEIITNYNIKNIEDLVRNINISKDDKQKSLECYKYVKNIVEINGFEPKNGHVCIQIDKYIFELRILQTGNIKYCKSLGINNIKNFTIIGINKH